MGIKLEMQKYDPIAQGYYRAIVADIETTEGQFGTQLKWKFELLDEEYTDRKLTAWCSALLSPKSKLNKWASAILGAAMPTDGLLDCDDLVNQKVMLDVIEEEGKDGNQYNKVREVLPWKGKARPVTPQRPAQPLRTSPPPPPDEDAYDYTDADEAAALADTSVSLF